GWPGGAAAGVQGSAKGRGWAIIDAATGDLTITRKIVTRLTRQLKRTVDPSQSAKGYPFDICEWHNGAEWQTVRERDCVAHEPTRHRSAAPSPPECGGKLVQ